MGYKTEVKRYIKMKYENLNRTLQKEIEEQYSRWFFELAKQEYKGNILAVAREIKWM